MRAAVRNRLLWAGLAVSVAIAAVGLLATRRPVDVRVRVCQPSVGDVVATVSTGGKVRPIDDFQARANFPGMVEKIYAEVGDKVSPGQILIKMKDPFASSRVATANSALRWAQAQDENVQRGGSQEERIALAGDLAHAELAQNNAANALAALRELQKKGAASGAEVAAAQQKLVDAQATLQTLQKRRSDRYSKADEVSAEARVKDARASLDAADVAFANANITSPQAGTVYSILVSQYDFVPMGAELLHVADLNHVEVRAYFDEPDIGELRIGQPVKIVWDAKPGKAWNGHVRRAPLAAMPMGARNVAESLIAVDDAKGDLLPNTNVTVTVTIREHHHVLNIPRAALRTDGAARFVYQVVHGHLVRTPVTVGITNLDRVEIDSGLNPDSVVALDSVDGQELSDQLPVEAVDAASAAGHESHLSTRIMPIEAGRRWAEALVRHSISLR